MINQIHLEEYLGSQNSFLQLIIGLITHFFIGKLFEDFLILEVDDGSYVKSSDNQIYVIKLANPLV